jgi:hypothetical protein
MKRAPDGMGYCHVPGRHLARDVGREALPSRPVQSRSTRLVVVLLAGSRGCPGDAWVGVTARRDSITVLESTLYASLTLSHAWGRRGSAGHGTLPREEQPMAMTCIWATVSLDLTLCCRSSEQCRGVWLPGVSDC